MVEAPREAGGDLRLLEPESHAFGFLDQMLGLVTYGLVDEANSSILVSDGRRGAVRFDTVCHNPLALPDNERSIVGFEPEDVATREWTQHQCCTRTYVAAVRVKCWRAAISCPPGRGLEDRCVRSMRLVDGPMIDRCIGL